MSEKRVPPSSLAIGLPRTVSEIDGDREISVENRQIFPPLALYVPAEGVSLGIGYRGWVSKTRMMGLPGRTKSLVIAYLQLCGYNTPVAAISSEQWGE